MLAQSLYVKEIVMSIGLFATEPVPLARIASCLSGEGVKVRATNWPAKADLESEIRTGILIVDSHGAGELCASLSKFLKGRRLIVCAPQPDSEGFKLLKELGAAEVITPRSWDPAHVCERILGQLIVDGDVVPANCGKLVGATRVMRDLFNDIATIAPLSDPVLILGESGTGKELVAAEVHLLSKRPDEFLPVNCGELSLELAGSDLFGHRKGSFTGATEARKGLLAEAGHGTIFLDEIGELDLKAQSKLLRVLEDNKVRRVGSNQMEPIHARIVLATNRNLETECAEGRFKSDLFERIRGFTIELQPLRERRADIPLLVQHFLSELEAETSVSLDMPDGALDCLFEYEWPGNVRELRAAVRKAAAFRHEELISVWHLVESTRRKRSAGESVTADEFPFSLGFDPAKDTWRDLLERARQRYFPAVLAAAGGNKTRVAALADLSPSQFYENLSPKRGRSRSTQEKGEDKTDSDPPEEH